LDPLHSEPKRIRKRQDKYQCSQCEYRAKKIVVCREMLKLNMRGWDILHNCEYAASTASDLNWFMLKINISEWDVLVLNVSMKQLLSLKRHVKNKHKGVRYPCKFVANSEDKLKSCVKVNIK